MSATSDRLHEPREIKHGQTFEVTVGGMLGPSTEVVIADLYTVNSSPIGRPNSRSY
ncbi:hypothetical protein GCM10009789_25970 [Kribbella sancticallisti]|uniref:Uncharacterized protein n=1 Tax=Kribbella sancticallisti TaxID=460087 RepID=A0ABP4P5H0_9ACTN